MILYFTKSYTVLFIGFFSYLTLSANAQNNEVFYQNESDFNPRSETERISGFKCKEYAKIAGRAVWIVPLVGTDLIALSVGNKTSRCKSLPSPLIVKGTEAAAGEFPHMAAIGWSTYGKIEFLCGGSLISERWVLTAAHCTHGSSGAPSVVKLGTNVPNDNMSGQMNGIKKIHRHPTYQPPAMYGDIALLELEKNVSFNDKVRPLCLYQEYDVTPSQSWATGWGLNETGGEKSDVLLKVQLDILDNLKCAIKYNLSNAVPRGITPKMICAADVSHGWKSDTCQGDSGGPLQIIHPDNNCMYQIVGITSFGRLCALVDSPGIYTRVSHYLDWIESIVWPAASK